MIASLLSKWFIPRAQFQAVKDELDDTLMAYDNLSRSVLGLTREVNTLERQGLELFKMRLEHRYAMFGKSEEQFSVMRTSYPRLGDLYVKAYRYDLD